MHLLSRGYMALLNTYMRNITTNHSLNLGKWKILIGYCFKGTPMQGWLVRRRPELVREPAPACGEVRSIIIKRVSGIG